MQLDRLTATLRPRRSWEGIDLGFALARHWFVPLWLLWWLSAIPGALLALLVLAGNVDWWLFLLWWLKPLFEAPMVVWVGRALFDDRIEIRRGAGLFKSAWTARLLPYLLWRRLSPGRSFNMPIALLEGLGGRVAGERRRVLSAGDSSAGWLTIVGYHFEAILWGGILLTGVFLIPEGVPTPDIESFLLEPQPWFHWLNSLVYLLAISIVAPFYVCAGFALYLTRRTDLEAWDLELAFRRAGKQRLGAPSVPGRSAGGGILAALLLVVATGWPGVSPIAAPMEAAPDTPLPKPDEAKVLIGEILEDPDFNQTREIKLWVPIDLDLDPDEPDPSGSLEWLEGIGELAAAIGPLLKWTLIAVAAALLVVLVRRIIRDWQPRGRLRGDSRKGWEQRSEWLPEAPKLPRDLAAAVRELLAAGDLRQALALLYRGGIAHLGRLGVQIPDGATEGECLSLAAGHLPPEGLTVFRDLTRDWQALAYAHRVPGPEQVRRRLEQWIAWTGAEKRTAGDGGLAQ